MSTGGATLHGSFSDALGTIQTSGFVWSTEENFDVDLANDLVCGSLEGTSGEFDCELDGLTAGRTYFYKAYVYVKDNETATFVPVYGNLQSFTTLPAESGIHDNGWLELPQLEGNEDFTGVFYGSGTQTASNRNYSYNYNYGYFASLWTAYPLTATHKTGNASTSKWYYNPNLNESYQINMTGSSYPTMYDADYSKGHQCPNADRKSDDLMNKQTYYCTNQTPQIQNGFNGGIWGSLETAVRNLVTSDSDTVYVVTGPAYRKVGGNETINKIYAATGQNANPTEVSIANYYWKALLKVKWSGNQIASASAIGFWFEHKQYSSDSYTNYIVSVDQIEEWTGFDLFHNLPNDKEATAEINVNWTAFQNF